MKCVRIQHKIQGNNVQGLSEGKVVLVFGARVLGDPQHDNGEHEGYTLRYIGITVIRELFRITWDDILQNQYGLCRARISDRSDSK